MVTNTTASVGLDAAEWSNDSELRRACAGFSTVILYGSVARGDANPQSDVDVLAVDARPRPPMDVGRISLTVYTEEHLRELARRGSLFLLHLRAEGRVLRDPQGVFKSIFEEWVLPDIPRMLSGMRAASAVLDASTDEGRACDPLSRLRVALYLLRSVLYLRCLELGDPVFAMDGVALRLKDDRIAVLFSRNTTDGVEERLLTTLGLLDQYLAGGRKNPFGSLEALAVSWHHQFPMAADLAIKILVGDSRIDYARSPADWVG